MNLLGNGIENIILLLLVTGVLGYMNKKAKKGKPNQTSKGLILKEQKIIRILGILLTAFCGIAVVMCVNQKEDKWVVILFAIFLLCGLAVWARGVFWKVIVNEREITIHSTFFGKSTIIPLGASIHAVYSKDGKKLKIYQDKKKILTLESNVIVGVDDFLKILQEADVKIEDLRLV